MIIALFLLLFWAAIFDSKSSKIPNLLILSGYLGGIIYLFAFEIDKLLNRFILSWFVMICLYVFFTLRALGAGDIKLLMMISIYLDFRDYLYVVAGAFLLAAIVAVYKLIKDNFDVTNTYIHLAFPIFGGFCMWEIIKFVGGVLA